MGGEADMVGAIGTVHRVSGPKGRRPAVMAGRSTTHCRKSCDGSHASRNYSDFANGYNNMKITLSTS
jgi:hypothetical protein